jgi:tetratricopeptide (TPR) repeat protein
MAFSKSSRKWLVGACLGLALSFFAVPSRAQYSEKDAPRPNLTADDYTVEEQREPIAAEHYDIEAELDPETHGFKSKVRIRLHALEPVSSIEFELNENLFPASIASEDGNFLSAQRDSSGLRLRVSLGRALKKDEKITISMELEGQFADAEYSPVQGVELAYVGEERSYLLYPARWFPIVGYGINRYTASLRFLVPPGYTVVSGGKAEAPVSIADKVQHTFVFDRPTFPGSVAVVPQSPDVVQAEGLTMKVYFSDDRRGMAQAYGEAAAQMVSFFASKFGPPPVADLSIVEIDDRSLGGYAGPQVLFLSSRAIGTEVNTRLLAQEVAQQWWRGLVSPGTRADLWLDHGLATYSEAMYLEHLGGQQALDERIKEMNIEALIHDTMPIRTAGGRLTEFTAPYKSLLYDKGGAALHMLRWVIGDDAFFTTLRELANNYAFQTATTDDFAKLASEASGQDLGPFFIQWMDSTGASNFTAEYVVYRTGDGFRVSGRIEQDQDVFSMPVEVEVETDSEPVTERVMVSGRAADFAIDTVGRPKRVVVDPNNRVLKYNDDIRLRVAVARGEQAVAERDYSQALEEYQKALDINRVSSLAHYRVAEVFFILRNYQSAANSFREALNGNLEPQWTEVWSHISLGKIST